MGRQGWGEVRAVVREGEGTGISQRRVYLLDFNNRYLSQAGACWIRAPLPLDRRGKEQGFRAQQTRWEKRGR